MTVLVTGGAGYIGSHVVRLLVARGERVVIVDDMSYGIPGRIKGLPLVEASVLDRAALERTMAEHQVSSVIHFAARKQVGESVDRPAWYWQENIGGMATLFEAMQAQGVDRLVYSSSAAVYGMPDVRVIGEGTACHPINPYGETKLAGEWLMRAAATAWDLRGVALRYFNVAGAGVPELADVMALNLVPIALDLLGKEKAPQIYGDDYPTADGTCIRDYIHVQDLADAHLAALDYLERDDRKFDTFNVGTGSGSSVREVLDVVIKETGIDLEPEVVHRRAGDPAALVADPSRINSVLGWKARFGLREIVETAVAAWRLRREESR